VPQQSHATLARTQTKLAPRLSQSARFALKANTAPPVSRYHAQQEPTQIECSLLFLSMSQVDRRSQLQIEVAMHVQPATCARQHRQLTRLHVLQATTQM